MTSYCGRSSEGWVRDDGPSTVLNALERGWGCVSGVKDGEESFASRSHTTPSLPSEASPEWSPEKIAKRVEESGASWTADPQALKDRTIAVSIVFCSCMFGWFSTFSFIYFSFTYFLFFVLFFCLFVCCLSV